MYQSLVEGREVPWALLVKDMPREKHRDLDFIVDQLDWEANVDPHFKENHYLEPIVSAGGEREGWVDKWIVYGKVRGEQLVHRQGADGKSRGQSDDQRQWGQFDHHGAGRREDQQDEIELAEDDWVFRADRG
jgi:hypothetical protein